MKPKATHYSRMVEAHDKSITLGGALTLFPVPESLTNAHAQIIKMAVERAERQAYATGYRDAQDAMRKALGLPAFN